MDRLTKVKYSSTLTGEPFLFYESRQVARLKLTGRNDQQIREEIKTQNLFQYATEKSLTKRITAVQKRVDTLMRRCSGFWRKTVCDG